MIVTFTANPSLDRTVELPSALRRGEVQRATAVRREPGGKGVNVSRALAASGLAAIAVLPGDDDDPVVTGLRGEGINYLNLPVGQALRSNIALTEPDGTTTKVNEPGPTLSPEQQDQLLAALLEHARGAAWLVLAGSLPPGVPDDFYARVTGEIRERLGAQAPRIAVDSSGAPLRAAVAGEAGPDLLKPNAEELAELTGIGDGDGLEADPVLAAKAAHTLVSRGVGAVLATLGSKGAILATAAGSWHATHAPITARSTVGAGDSALAGYLLAHTAGSAPSDCLRQAVAHGAAAASLPGSTVPTVDQTSPNAVTVAAL